MHTHLEHLHCTARISAKEFRAASSDGPGLARTAFIAPAIAPAAAISFNDSWKGDMMRFDTPYAANSREFTPAMPTKGLNIPTRKMMSKSCKGCNGEADLCKEQRTLPFGPFAAVCPWDLSKMHTPCGHRGRRVCATTHKHPLCNTTLFRYICTDNTTRAYLVRSVPSSSPYQAGVPLFQSRVSLEIEAPNEMIIPKT